MEQGTPHIKEARGLYAPELCGASCVAQSNTRDARGRLTRSSEGKGNNKMAEATTTGNTTPKKPKTVATTTTVPPVESAATPMDTAAPKTSPNKEEAKTRFNAALDEAKAGAAALKAEAGVRASAYRDQAKSQSDDWMAEARAYGDQAKGKAGELAVDGKAKAAEAISSLGKVVSENAVTLDEKLGVKYGDYARSASRSLQETADKLDSKSVDELGEDAREFVRKSPGLAIGMAAAAGYFLSRILRR